MAVAGIPDDELDLALLPYKNEARDRLARHAYNAHVAAKHLRAELSRLDFYRDKVAAFSPGEAGPPSEALVALHLHDRLPAASRASAEDRAAAAAAVEAAHERVLARKDRW